MSWDVVPVSGTFCPVLTERVGGLLTHGGGLPPLRMQRAVTVAVVGLAIVLVDDEKVEKDKVLGKIKC